MFRRRRRGGEQATGVEPEVGDYPAADDELAEQDNGEGEWAGEELAADEWPEDEWAEAEQTAYSADEDVASEERAGDGPGGLTEPARQRSDRPDLGDPATWTRLRDSQVISPAMTRSAGPWDGAGEYPEGERIDFGSLLVPVREGFDVQVFVSEQDGISIAVVSGESGLQLQPFAAPRSSGLWHEVMPEIGEEVAKAGGQSAQQNGPFGPELLARVVPQGAEGHDIPPQLLRFLGADGPRWFLRGLISGPAADDAELAIPFEEIFADVVVVRGEHAEPPRKPLEIRLPDEARQVLEGQLAAQDQDQDPFSPFERGPEITETR
ncbi:MAG TPA: DUF3710 domain-containing protein [Streptosporangiaceae bacterium]|nr:DUF3710 domain-containing protein [Streptosporangiaceae bacterium]